MSHIIVGRWGKNLAVRLPAEIAKEAGLKVGARVDIGTRDGDIVIRRLMAPVSLAELFKGRSAQEWRDAYAGAFDWGPDVGREIVDE